MDSILQILHRLNDHNVEFVIIGGMAATLHGCSLVTEDLDLAVAFSPRNSAGILAAIADLHPVHRMTPGPKPLTESPLELAKFENLYLRTDLGQVDFLSQVSGIGGFQDALADTVVVDIEGCSCRVLGLESLIRSKEALGRARDLRAVAQLRALLDRLQSG